ncbi:Deoxycytidine triphosphate deaminase, partial [mine drainage metagenome]
LLISENFNEKSITPNGYDFRINLIRVDGSESDNINLLPGKYALVSSMEYFAMPKDVIGNIWIRSSFARRGIIGSFGVIDAGYHGNITVGLYNAGDQVVKLESGERIAQIVFSRLSSESEKDYSLRSGNYQGKRGISEFHGKT